MVPILMKLITPPEDERVNTGRKKFQMMIMLCEEKERESQGGGVCEVMGGVEATEEASEEGREGGGRRGGFGSKALHTEDAASIRVLRKHVFGGVQGTERRRASGGKGLGPRRGREVEESDALSGLAWARAGFWGPCRRDFGFCGRGMAATGGF